MVFWMLGFGLMFGVSLGGVTGTGFFFFNPSSVWAAVFLLFQAVFCSTSATIVSGAVAERMRFSSYYRFHRFAVGDNLSCLRSLGLGRGL
jgi:Amt family ammonium transporter